MSAGLIWPPGAVSQAAREKNVRILLLVNGPRERYVGGADTARQRTWSQYCSPGTELEVGYLPSFGPDGAPTKIYAFGAADAMQVAHLYPDRCAQAEQEGFHAVIIHCFVDPGLYAARARVNIPVVGPGEVTLRAAAMLDRKIGVSTPSVASVDHTWPQVRELGIENKVVAIEPIIAPLAPFDQQDPAAMLEVTVEALQRLVDKGAEVICPSGLAYIPIRVSAQEVSERIGVPVLDPALFAVRTAEMLVLGLSPRAATASLVG
jgi:allantoin racemase